MDEAQLSEIVKKVVALHAAEPKAAEKTIDAQTGVVAVRTTSVRPAPFATGNDGDRVFLSDILTLEESPRLGCGIMEMHASCFNWVLKYDEIDYVISGRLEIVIDNKKVIGEAGDIIYIPKDTAIQFSVPDSARFLYVTYPADWQNIAQPSGL